MRTNGEKDMLVAKSEARAVENFGMFLMHIPRLEFLNVVSSGDPGANEIILFTPSSQCHVMCCTLPTSGSCLLATATIQLGSSSLPLVQVPVPLFVLNTVFCRCAPDTIIITSITS